MRFKMLDIIKVTIFISLCVTLSSCGPVPFASVMGGPVSISFHGETGGTSRDMGDIVAYSEMNTIPSRYNETTNPALQDWFDNYYSNLGILQQSFTPTKFVLPINLAALMNQQTMAPIVGGTGVLGLNTDFTDPSAAVASDVSRGFYEILYIDFVNYFERVQTMDTWGNPYAYLNMISAIDINLTGYNSIPEEGPFLDPDGDITGWWVKKLGIEQYRFTFGRLQPVLSDSVGGIDPISMGPKEIEALIFSTKVNTPTLVTPESIGEMMSTAEFTLYTSAYRTGSMNILILPWNGLDIPYGINKVIVALTLDTDGIIEVYNDGSNDTVVLANNFWERFNLNVTYE